MEFETLSSLDKNGKRKLWSIQVIKYPDYSEIKTVFGYETGKKTESITKIETGKNKGKKNETGHYEQAIAEAKSKWEKKRDSIQQEDKPKFPMLAHEFKKHEKKVIYPCYVQPKLDGYRMIYDSTKRTITTRQGKDLPIIRQSGRLFDELDEIPPGLILDGELYVHDGASFEALGVLRKTKNLSEKELSELQKINYHVYDLVDENSAFEERLKTLDALFGVNPKEKIKGVETFEIKNKEELLVLHDKFIKEGYEGSMVRSQAGKYKEKYRSYDLLKYKDFMDEEFEITGFTFESDHLNPEDKLVIWIIKVADGIECNVRPKGNKEDKRYLYEHASEFIGKKLWVKFFDYTGDGSLRFPTTNRESYLDYIRDEVV
jgi:DNA ligase-1